MLSVNYSLNCVTFDPKGKILQIEYAKEAVKQGSTSLGLKSDNFVVLVSLKKSPHDLASHQEKVFDIDDHMGIAIAGLTADARYLCKFMRSECLNYWYTHDSHHPTERLINKIAKKSQIKTNHPAKRPFGVGLLVGSVDETGTHLFETCPSGNYYEYIAMAIGSRNQSAKTYLEKNYQSFSRLGWEELAKHGLRALKASAQETELSEHIMIILALLSIISEEKNSEKDIIFQQTQRECWNCWQRPEIQTLKQR